MITYNSSISSRKDTASCSSIWWNIWYKAGTKLRCLNKKKGINMEDSFVKVLKVLRFYLTSSFWLWWRSERLCQRVSVPLGWEKKEMKSQQQSKRWRLTTTTETPRVSVRSVRATPSCRAVASFFSSRSQYCLFCFVFDSCLVCVNLRLLLALVFVFRFQSIWQFGEGHRFVSLCVAKF